MYMQIDMSVGHILIYTIFAMQIICRLTSKYVHVFKLLRIGGEKRNENRLEFSSQSFGLKFVENICDTFALETKT